jgi:outer membrane immunogenic protein
MTCPCASAAASRSRASRRRDRIASACAAAAFLTMAAGQAMAADWLDDTLRGSYTASGPVRWDGVYFGAHMGVANMNTDFGNGTSGLIAYIFRNTTIENENPPSAWTTLPNNTTNGRTYGVFLGYNMQWSDLVVGFQGAYNRPSSTFHASASDTIDRFTTLSDNIRHSVHIASAASIDLVDYATFTGRAGYAFGQFLPYAVLGAAVGRFNYTNSATATDQQTLPDGTVINFTPPTSSSAKNNAIVGGFVVGLGIDVAVLPNVFLRAEWEYAAFAPVGGIRVGLNTGRVGVGVRF